MLHLFCNLGRARSLTSLAACVPYMTKQYLFRALAACAVCLMWSAAKGAPFRVNSAADLAEDGRLFWTTISAVDGSVVANGTTAGTTRGDTNFMLVGGDPTTMSIWNPGGAPGGGAMLANTGPGGVYLFANRALQGIGVMIGHQASVSATYQLDYFGSDGGYLGSVSKASPGSGGEPVFLGVVDPEARIWTIGLHAGPGNSLVLSNPVFQIAPIATEDPAVLPVAAQVTLQVEPVDTYLHEGLNSVGSTPETVNAVEDNANAHDLNTHFSGLRAGDILRFERQGLSLQGGQINPLMAVFTRTQVIKKGTEFRRLPTALDAGSDFYTPQVRDGAFTTGTNIPEDFLVGVSTFVSVPADARYLLFSLAQPSPAAGPIRVKVSHIPRRVFEDWLDRNGLHGNNAALDADLDGDGLKLLEEFAFQKDPTVPDARPDLDFAFAPKLGQLSSNGRISLVFGGRLNAPLRYTAEFSADLITWESRPTSAVIPLLTDAVNNRALFEVVDTMTGPRRFGRIRIEYVPPLP